MRHLTSEIAYNPSWAGDSRHVLYQSNDKLRLMDLETGEDQRPCRWISPISLCAQDAFVVHVGKLVDGVAKTARNNMDIVIDGNRITSVEPHVAGRADTIDAPELTAMPGLIDNPQPSPKRFRRAAGPYLPGLWHHHGAESRALCPTKRWKTARRAMRASACSRASSTPAI